MSSVTILCVQLCQSTIAYHYCAGLLPCSECTTLLARPAGMLAHCLLQVELQHASSLLGSVSSRRYASRKYVYAGTRNMMCS